MEKIILIYGPEKGSTEKVAQKIAAAIGNEQVELVSASKASQEKIEKSKKLIFGCSTIGRDSWNGKHVEMGWDSLIFKLEEIDFTGKTVALFGLGNHIFYPENFVDTMGAIGKIVAGQKANLVGEWSTAGYEYTDSQAINANKNFVGLAIDEDNEPELTDERIEKWVKQIKSDF